MKSLLIYFLLGYIQLYANGRYFDSKTVHWSESNFNKISQEIVSSILSSTTIDFSKKNICSFKKIKNSTYDHIDMQNFKNIIIKRLQKSGRFGFENSADKIFYGELSSSYQTNFTKKDMFFKFVLNLLDIQSGEIIWSDTVEIRKIHQKKLFGW